MNKIKILHVVSSLNMGGVQTLIMSIYRNINKDLFHFDFTTMNQKNIFTEEVNDLGGNVYYIFSHRHPIKHYFQLRKVLRQGCYDVVHIHSNNAICIIEAIIVKIHSKSKVFVHSHNTSGGNPIIHKILKPFIPIFADKMIGCSKAAVEYMFPLKANKKNSCIIINNGIVSSHFGFNEEIREQYRNNLNIDNKLVIGTIGRFWEQKNPDGIISILVETIKINQEALLLWVGDGPLRTYIEEKISCLNLSGHIILTGNRNDANNLLQAMDVFIFPSIYEGLGIAAIESQAAGLPTLCSKHIPKEVAVTDLCSFLDLDDYKEWAEKIIETYNLPRLSRERDIKSAGFDILSSCDKMSHIYLSVKK